MIFTDYHIHSGFSFDGEGDFSKILDAAEKGGISEISFTDHCDFTEGESEIPCSYNKSAVIEAFKRVKENNKTDVKLRLGVEMGQSGHAPKAALALLEGAPFDVVLGSLHNLRGEEDFYFKNYRERLKVLKLLYAYFGELIEMCETCDFDVLAHLTYPLRYMGDLAGEVMFSDYKEYIDGVLRVLISKGRALEVNTSGYRSHLCEPIPGMEILKYYRSIGGEMVTLGSDSHRPECVGSGIREGCELLLELGFSGVFGYKRRSPYFIPF